MRGILDTLNRIIDITVPRFNQQGGTRVVPGHGRILNEADVVEYRDMMTIIYDRVKAGVDAGQTFDQVMSRTPTLEYDGLYSTPQWTGRMLRRPSSTSCGAAARRPRARAANEPRDLLLAVLTMLARGAGTGAGGPRG